jgi:uncharacterized membrane protein YhaH (DUF805 family)
MLDSMMGKDEKMNESHVLTSWRIGRAAYAFLYISITTFAFLMTAWSVDLFGPDALDPVRMAGLEGGSAIAAAGLLAAYSALWVPLVLVTMARLRDVGRPEWLAFGIAIPMVAVALPISLMIAPGDPFRNRFGPPS